ncbi:MAG TPA: type 2 lanthipeptide synthetase LanM family protein [Ktedonobacteraceae bacterium]|nr:type 2 lanthipeptide synthetase LanM family protein [Ktedonobacteraceae bacterium]
MAETTRTASDRQSQPGKETFPWWQTASLNERLPLPVDISSTGNTPEQEKRAARQLQRWQEAFGENQELYRQWLEQAGLQESELSYLLNEPSEMLHQRTQEKPAWVHTFETAYTQSAAPDEFFSKIFVSLVIDTPVAREQERETGEPDETRYLLTVAEPLLHLGYQRLLTGMRTLQQQVSGPDLDVPALATSLLTTLVVRLQNILARTLILEFRVAQQQGLFSADEGVLTHFQAHAHRLRNLETALAFFREYPVLARQVALCVEQWCASNLEMLTRLHQDWPSLQQILGETDDPGALQQIQTGLGDTHQSGRSVGVLRFASGFQLVYKPRSLAIDLHFQQLLQWLNERGQNPPLRLLRLLSCKDYGWVEWVEACGCTSPDEIERFYLRQGAYLALLYILGATDFHFENILADGEHPVLIDLESLLHVHSESPTSALSSAEQQAYENVASSVMRTLLLPYRAPGDDGAGQLDVSGLGGAAGQIIPQRALRLSGFETGELRYVRDRAILAGGKNRPTLQGEEVEVSSYLPQIIVGFTSTYRLLLSQRETLLSDDGPLASFANDTTRVIFRSTSNYALLLRTCSHPYLLHSELDRERVMHQLWRTVGMRPQMRKLVAWEEQDLRQGDIPCFTTQIQTRDLWTSSGQRLTNFFAHSGWDLLQQRWHKLSEQDLSRQVWFIQAAFATLTDGDQTWQQELSVHSSQEPAEQLHASGTDSASCLAAACTIGERICQLALGEAGETTWLGLTQLDKEQWTLAVADINLYNGLAGILLTLAYLGNLTDNRYYTQVARAAYMTMQKSMAERRHELKAIGFFGGWGGILALLAHLTVLWQDDSLLQEAAQIMEMLPPLIAQDEHLDIVGGSAGCIAGLLCLEKVAPSRQITALLKQCGDHLATTAIATPAGIGWPVLQTKQPLTGFAHGAAGFAWALLHLARNCGETRFQRLALATLGYERSHYSPLYKNWLDVRGMNRGQEARYCVAWCYGAPGIGLARLDTLDILDSELVRAEIEAALETTNTGGFGSNHSLCHGDFGNLELLYRAQHIWPDQRWQATYKLKKAILLENGQQHGWRCGTPHQVETPGLMVGLAGICLQLLRIAQPARVPSILTMAPPSSESR